MKKSTTPDSAIELFAEVNGDWKLFREKSTTGVHETFRHFCVAQYRQRVKEQQCKS